MKYLRFIPTLLIAAVLFSGCAASQGASNSKAPASAASKPSPKKKDDGPKKFSEVIKDDFVKDEGVFNIYRDSEKYYYEIR